jgi:tetratricopeptide (TPR) repeat protein
MEARVAAIEARLIALDESIARAPDSAAAYVLRGELYLEARCFAAARDDFARALRLAEAQYRASDWGVVAQAMRDRAADGLARASRGLSREQAGAAS